MSDELHPGDRVLVNCPEAKKYDAHEAIVVEQSSQPHIRPRWYAVRFEPVGLDFFDRPVLALPATSLVRIEKSEAPSGAGGEDHG